MSNLSSAPPDPVSPLQQTVMEILQYYTLTVVEYTTMYFPKGNIFLEPSSEEIL